MSLVGTTGAATAVVPSVDQLLLARESVLAAGDVLRRGGDELRTLFEEMDLTIRRRWDSSNVVARELAARPGEQAYQRLAVLDASTGAAARDAAQAQELIKGGLPELQSGLAALARDIETTRGAARLVRQFVDGAEVADDGAMRAKRYSFRYTFRLGRNGDGQIEFRHDRGGALEAASGKRLSVTVLGDELGGIGDARAAVRAFDRAVLAHGGNSIAATAITQLADEHRAARSALLAQVEAPSAPLAIEG